jgi:hypothetical protein
MEKNDFILQMELNVFESLLLEGEELTEKEVAERLQRINEIEAKNVLLLHRRKVLNFFLKDFKF